MDELRITVAGVGGGGSRIVDRLADEAVRTVRTVAINTDARALASSRAESTIQIGKGRTEGLGTGGDAAMGRKAAEDDLDLVRGILADTSLLFVVVGLGGGTGSGATPLLLQEAREAGLLTLCFATLPFRFEGPQRRAQADRSAAQLRELCNGLIVVPNDRLFETVGDLGVPETFARADAILGGGVAGVCRLMTTPGHLNLDLADLRHVIQNGLGQCTLAHAEGFGEDKANQALSALLGGPLLDHGEVLARTGSVITSIAGDADLRMKDVSTILESVASRVPSHCYVGAGTVIEDSWHDRVAITVIAAESAPAHVPAKPQTEETAATEEAAKITSRGRKRSGAATAQARLRLDAPVRGRFKDVEPTMLEGEDLDIPTYQRRGLALER
jgi:cell division protein FtsZ